jgi:hypothetical protein
LHDQQQQQQQQRETSPRCVPIWESLAERQMGRAPAAPRSAEIGIISGSPLHQTLNLERWLLTAQLQSEVKYCEALHSISISCLHTDLFVQPQHHFACSCYGDVAETVEPIHGT